MFLIWVWLSGVVAALHFFFGRGLSGVGIAALHFFKYYYYAEVVTGVFVDNAFRAAEKQRGLAPSLALMRAGYFIVFNHSCHSVMHG